MDVAAEQGSVVRLALESGANAAKEMVSVLSKLTHAYASSSETILALAALPDLQKEPAHRIVPASVSLSAERERLLLVEKAGSSNSTGTYTPADIANYNVFVWFAALWSLATIAIL